MLTVNILIYSLDSQLNGLELDVIGQLSVDMFGVIVGVW
jgi:hypothetical protein